MRMDQMSKKFTVHSLLDEVIVLDDDVADGDDTETSLLNDLDVEIERYTRFISREMDPRDPTECPLTFWKLVGNVSFPALAPFVKIILGQPIGTADVERRCSSVGNIITKARNRLGDIKIDQLLMIPENSNEDWAQSIYWLNALNKE
jgi:hAT family C-terminal dimerisation region